MSDAADFTLSHLKLRRFPLQKKQLLRAWDAADVYLLNYLETHQLDGKNILIFNDPFGALSLSLHSYKPCCLLDSYLSQQSIINNCEENSLDISAINFLNPFSPLIKNYDYVLIKAPKTLDFLRYFLKKISSHLTDDSQIILAGMVKHMPKAIWNIMGDNFDDINTSLTKKKAKLIFAKNFKAKKREEFTNFKQKPIFFIQDKTQYKIYAYANVFSKNNLDIGTRFLLENLPQLTGIKKIVDLGCGNGILGLNLAKTYPNAHIIFTDESYMAIESAKLNIKENIEENIEKLDRFTYQLNDCLSGIKHDFADLIVCNPPFHQNHNVGVDIAMRMFKQSLQRLIKNGYFIVVANRHLPYYSPLKRLFNKVETIASNNKFSIYLAQK